jgi:hypothetical protein
LHAGKESWRLNSYHSVNGSPRRTPAACAVAGLGLVRATAAELPALRQKPGPVGGEPLSPSFLKNSDDQTVAGIAAVVRAIDAGGLRGTSFRDWGVVAASRFLGRTAMAQAVLKFQAEGAWGISPHLIPHRSLHSLSGTVSQALKVHGPNFGTGGGPGGAADALLTATALLHGGQLPGVWLVLTGWEPEPRTDEKGQILNPDCVCDAVALALMPAGGARLSLRVVPAGTESRRNGHGGISLLSLEAVVRALADPAGPPTAVVWQLPSGGRVELERRVIGTNGAASSRSREPSGTVGLLGPARLAGPTPSAVGAEKMS